MSSILNKIFFFVWKRRLLNTCWTNWNKKPTYNNVAIVKGWRSALVDSYAGQRSRVTFMIKIWKWYI